MKVLFNSNYYGESISGLLHRYAVRNDGYLCPSAINDATTIRGFALTEVLVSLLIVLTTMIGSSWLILQESKKIQQLYYQVISFYSLEQLQKNPIMVNNESFLADFSQQIHAAIPNGVFFNDENPIICWSYQGQQCFSLDSEE